MDSNTVDSPCYEAVCIEQIPNGHPSHHYPQNDTVTPYIITHKRVCVWGAMHLKPTCNFLHLRQMINTKVSFVCLCRTGDMELVDMNSKEALKRSDKNLCAIDNVWPTPLSCIKNGPTSFRFHVLIPIGSPLLLKINRDWDIESWLHPLIKELLPKSKLLCVIYD